MSLQAILFCLLAAISVVATIMTIRSSNPVTSALYLVLNFFALGGIYLTLEAQFIAVVQVIVYAGAIMVLFLFVLMLLNLEHEQKIKNGLRSGFAVLLSAVMFIEILYIIGINLQIAPVQNPSLTAEEIGTAKFIGKAMLTNFLFPFEVISILLLAAIIGAIVLAKKNFR
jgi:NADH-quinone oxidoreductase subunit J